MDKPPNLDALRGAYVSLWHEHMDCVRAAEDLRHEAAEWDKKADRFKRMALAAQDGFVSLGGDANEARNYWSWTYE